jgi:hypothetical protein
MASPGDSITVGGGDADDFITDDDEATDEASQDTAAAADEASHDTTAAATDEVGHDTPAVAAAPSFAAAAAAPSTAHASTSRSTSRRSAKGKGPSLQRVKWKPEMLDKLLEWLHECKVNGMFNSTKAKDYIPVWEYCMARSQEAWPQYSWSQKQISTKYDTERRRYLAFQTVMKYSGTSYDEATGLVITSDDVWEAFFKRYPRRKYGWLRDRPLGRRELHEEVFSRETPAGNHIREAGGRSIADETEDIRESDSDDEFTGSLDDEVFTETSVPSRSQEGSRRMSLLQKRRLETDPDSTSVHSIDTDDLRPMKIRSKKPPKKFDSEDSLSESITKLSRSIETPKVAGANDLSKAVLDFQTRYAGKISPAEALKCIRRLQADALVAVVWNTLPDEWKDAQVEEWRTSDT